MNGQSGSPELQQALRDRDRALSLLQDEQVAGPLETSRLRELFAFLAYGNWTARDVVSHLDQATFATQLGVRRALLGWFRQSAVREFAGFFVDHSLDDDLKRLLALMRRYSSDPYIREVLEDFEQD